MSKKEISRRKFIKSGLIGFAGLSSPPGLFKQPESAQNPTNVSRTSLKPLLAIPTTCEQCPAGCGVIGHLDGDRLVRLSGNPNHPNNNGRICAKGIAGLNLVNDPKRLNYPLKRRGSRGSGQWIQISWDEVYSTLAERIKNLLKTERVDGFVVDKGQSDPILERFLTAVGTKHVIDRHAIKNINRDSIFISMTGFPYLIEDVRRSRTILNFGANPYENHDQFIGIAQRLVDARIRKGARLFTFDVRMSKTAAMSDKWYPLRPGSDGIVALAIARVIIEEGLADEEFMGRQTNCSLERLRDHLAPYTPEAAEKESGIKTGDIIKLALEYAAQKPSLTIIGGGVFDHENGSQNARCISLLNWIVGNLEKPGGLIFPQTIEPFEQPPSQRSRLEHKIMFRGIEDLKKKGSKIDTYFAFLSNPAFSEPNCRSITELLSDESKVSFLIVMDTHLTETALLADMVLPAATYLEGWGIKSVPSLDGIPLLNFRQPVATLQSASKVLRSPDFDVGKLLSPSFRPKGEAEEIGNVCLEISRRIGGDISKSLPFKNTQDYVTKAIKGIPALHLEKNSKDFKNLGVWSDTNAQKQRNHKKNSTLLKNYRVKILDDSLLRKNQTALPEYKPLSLQETKKKEEFVLTTFKSNLFAKGSANCKWSREISHVNPLWINKETAKKLGLKNRDRVRVTSTIGTLNTSILTTSRIHPESVALEEGFGHTGIGDFAKAKKSKSTDQDTNLIWWEKEGPGVNPNEIIERITDPFTGGFALKDTVVKIEKIECKP